MSCDEYRKYELGKLDKGKFESHSQNCPVCQKHLQQDVRLLELTKSLKQPIEAPSLWTKIENTLRAEKYRRRPVWFDALRRQKFSILKVAAVLIFVIGLGSYFIFKPDRDEPRLLAASALQKVEEKEREYATAIEELEQVALPQLTQMDTDLMLLYRDRLETIDAQIDRCKEALASNPANAHIRRYLLAALQDKRQTLRELVEYDSSVL